MTLKNNRAPLLCCFQLCAWFHCHMWIQTGVRVRKRLSWVLTSVTLTFDLWPWPFAWTSLLTMVITPENLMMIRWWEHGEKGVTDRRTDGQTDGRTDRRTDWTSHIAAWSQLKMDLKMHLPVTHVYLSGACIPISGLIPGLRPANERRRYKVTPSLIGCVQTWNQPCILICATEFPLVHKHIFFKFHLSWASRQSLMLSPVILGQFGVGRVAMPKFTNVQYHELCTGYMLHCVLLWVGSSKFYPYPFGLLHWFLYTFTNFWQFWFLPDVRHIFRTLNDNH